MTWGVDVTETQSTKLEMQLMEQLTLSKKLVLTVLGFVVVVGPVAFGAIRMIPLHGQLLHATGPRPSFEVASIRPSKPNAQWENPDVLNEHLSYREREVTIRALISYAYGIGFAPEFSGGPTWVKTDKFDIEAKPDEAETAALKKLSFRDRDEQMRLMVQSLLAERFNLKVSFEKRELPVYALVVAKGGLKCMKSTDTSHLTTATRFEPPPPPPPPPGGVAPGEVRVNTEGGWPLSLLVALLNEQPELGGRMVVDKTGLEGPYDCKASWASEGTDFPGPSLFTAIQEQMGLKLELTKGPAEVLVVDHIDRPSEN